VSVWKLVKQKPSLLNEALGDLSSIKEEFRPLFVADSDFPLVLDPRPSDWLACHEEAGQYYDEYVKSKMNKVDKLRNKIYILPIGSFSEESPSLEDLCDFTTRFFQLEVKILPSKTLSEKEFTPRINEYTNNVQILTTDILDFLISKLPPDAYCLVAITMTDLYPKASWNFVFGQARLIERVGVFSLYCSL
jgi:archaemetzincin